MADGKPWTLARVLGLMDKESRTGILEVVNEQMTARVHMRKGYVVAINTSDAAGGWRLGDHLTDSGACTAEQLLSARKEATKKGLDIEDVLIKSGRVSEDTLRRLVDVHISDLLMPLFRQEGANFKFLEERPIPARCGTALPVSFVVREAERQIERWPALRQRLGHESAVYKKDAALMGEILGYEDPEPEMGEAMPELTANARAAYFFLDGERSIAEVARAAGLTMFDTYSAMNELMDSYLLTLVPSIGEGGRRKRKTSHLARAVTLLTWVLVAGVLALGGEWAWRSIDQLKASATASSPVVDAAVRDARLHQTDEAIQLFEIHYGSFPDELRDLVDSGYMTPHMASAISTMRYEKTPDGYRLGSRYGERSSLP